MPKGKQIPASEETQRRLDSLAALSSQFLADNLAKPAKPPSVAQELDKLPRIPEASVHFENATSCLGTWDGRAVEISSNAWSSWAIRHKEDEVRFNEELDEAIAVVALDEKDGGGFALLYPVE